MRSRLSAPTVTLFLLSTLFLLTSAARAADDTYNDDDEYEERARVLRVSLLKGEVTLKRAGGDEWEDVRLNSPLVEGDVLATGRDSRLEIQADARNFVRVGPDSVIKVVTLRDEGIALSLSEGTATFRLSHFDKTKEYFELDAPGTTVAAERVGQYRVDVERDGAVRVTVREDGRARIYSQNSGFVLRNDRTARLAPDASGEADWEFMAAAGSDEWDAWNEDRERYLAERLKFEGRDRYYDTDVYGAEELDAYGDWVYTSNYGYVWRPHTTVINVYNDWAPYRYGRWVWCPPYGWTWVADEPWGWAPYHYGRWVYYNSQWCWAPRGYGYRYRRAWWRPALVAFITIDFGRDRHVCWYPLTYGQRDPRGRRWSREFDRLSPLRGRDAEHLRRQNPYWLRAVSTAPAREFGERTLRPRAAGGDLAERALTGEPVRGQLPIQRPDATRGAPRVGGARPTGADGRDTLSINRPTPIMPPRPVSERTTGAAARTPGAPLEGELRRTRVFNNREPRMPSAPDATGVNSPTGPGPVGGDTNTGAVERPRNYGTPATNPGGDSAQPVRARPTRPVEPAPGGGYPNGDDAMTPKRRPRDTGGDNVEPRARPTQPSGDAPREASPRDESSSPVYRPRYEPRVRPRDDNGGSSSTPARREAPPSYNPEPSAPRESPSRREAPEPRHESPRSEPRPEPRREQPRQEAPRDEPRQEAPRQEAPRREAPRQEAPRQEAPRHRDPDAPRPRERPDNR
ncbi:MAG: FecR domain-containing protein [Acidobacteria bacterium]|nr:FecR domain-containing protein [Acidobacteriota bacterium]